MFYYSEEALIYIYNDSNSVGEMFYYFKVLKYLSLVSHKAMRAEALKS